MKYCKKCKTFPQMSFGTLCEKCRYDKPASNKISQDKVASLFNFKQVSLYKAEDDVYYDKDKANLWSSRLEDLKELLNKKIPLKTIARKYGVSKQRISQILQANGIKSALRQHKDKMVFTSIAEAKIYKLVITKTKRDYEAREALLKELLPAPRNCPVLGIEIDYNKSIRVENGPSIDRINNNKGYISGNCLVVSWRANRLKNDGTAEEHLKIYQYYSNN